MTAKKNAGVGALLLVIWGISFVPTLVELALAFAFLVLVPLILQLSISNAPYSWTQLSLNRLSRVSVFFAVAGVASLTVETGIISGVLAMIWFSYTAAISLFGLLQLIGRGIRPAEETIIDVGIMYIVVGGGWLVLSRSGAAVFLPYSEVIVELTAIHFHYAAFVLPVLTGVFGRWLFQQKYCPRSMNSYKVLALGIGLGPVLVALGLDHGPPLELYFVSVYVLFLFWLCGWWLISTGRMKLHTGILIGFSAMILLGTMSLSFLYSLGLLLETTIISIPEMIRWHGALNAFGFALLATVAWLIISPHRRYDYTRFPVSGLPGRGFVGEMIFTRLGWLDEDRQSQLSGLIDSWEKYEQLGFNPNRIHALIKEFYIDTTTFHIEADVIWHKEFRALSHISYFFTKRMGQINLPPTQTLEMNGAIVPVSEKKDGRNSPRAWIRKNSKTDEPIFAAVYSSHTTDGISYMNIALPMYRGVMTGVLRPTHYAGNGLALTSKKTADQRGDEGIYITLGKVTVKTPMEETFYVTAKDEGMLEAVHNMTLFKRKFLTIHYKLYK